MRDGTARQDGQALVEVAFALPILLLLLLALMEFGLMFGGYLQVQHGAREGARLAAVGGTDQEILERVRAAASTLNPTRLAVEVAPDESLRFPGETVAVRVRYVYEPVLPWLRGLTGDSIDLRAAYRMRLE